MKTTDEIMELADEYANYSGHCVTPLSRTALKSAIEELASDAEYGRSMRLSTIIADMKAEPLSNADTRKILIEGLDRLAREAEGEKEEYRELGICSDCKGEGEQGGIGKFENLKVNATHDYKEAP